MTDHMSAADAREQRVVESFVELADTLVDDFDVLDLLHTLVERCVELLDIAESGLLLADQAGNLQVMAASNERTHLLELFQIQGEQGPCLDSYRQGEPVTSDDLDADRERWPDFVPKALDAGFHAVHALPMRLRGDVIGALNLFGTEVGALPPADATLGQAMADIATIGIIQERSVQDAQHTAAQLQHALDSRVIIEQAKGMLAEHGELSMAEAFERLRHHARDHNLRLSDVARDVVDGGIEVVLGGQHDRSAD